MGYSTMTHALVAYVEGHLGNFILHRCQFSEMVVIWGKIGYNSRWGLGNKL